MTESIGSHLNTSAHDGPRGFGGWLAFACVITGLMALSFGLLAFVAWRSPERFGLAPGAESLVGAALFGVLALAAAVTTQGLWREKNYARWLALGIFGLLFLGSLPSLLSIRPDTIWAQWRDLRDVAYTGGMLGYFIRSVRVKNTLVN